MQYDKLSKEEKREHERLLIEKADDFWIKTYGKKEASDIDKLRLLSRQGKIQDKFQHDVMIHYFKKQGFWRDGKTPLEEREKQLVLKKAEFGNKIAKVKSNTIADIDEIIKRANQKKEQLNKIPVQMKESFKINKQKILETLRNDLQSLYGSSEDYIEKEISEVYNDFLKNVQERQNNMIDKARTKIHDLQKTQKMRVEQEVERFGSELEAELAVLEYKENDDQLIKQYNDEIKKINQELNEIREPIIEEDTIEVENEEIFEEPEENDIFGEAPEEEIPIGLENLTVKQLKELADKNGIEYNAHILKADLIEKILE